MGTPSSWGAARLRTYGSRGAVRGAPKQVSAGPGTRRVGASSAARPARSQTPRPVRPFLRVPLPPGARRHTGSHARSGAWAAGSWKCSGGKRAQAEGSPSSLQENQLTEPTSPEKLCSKLGESTEWLGLFNRRFQS